MIEPDKSPEFASPGHTERQAILTQPSKAAASPSAINTDLEQVLADMEEAIADEGGILTP